MRAKTLRSTTASTEMIDPRVPPPRVYVVDPAGRIRGLSIVRNISHYAVDQRGNVTPEAAAAGWATIEELYQREHDDEGLAAWREYLEVKARGMKASFPDVLLPEAVRQRRRQAVTPPEWTPPQRKAKTGAAT